MAVEPVSSHISPAVGVARQCVFFSDSITSCNVVCEGCGSLFQAETVCLVVSDAVIAILLDGEGAAAYNWSRCRGGTTRSQGVQGYDFGTVNQMWSIMEKIVFNVKKLAQIVADLQKAQNSQNHLANSNRSIRPNQSSILGDVR